MSSRLDTVRSHLTLTRRHRHFGLPQNLNAIDKHRPIFKNMATNDELQLTKLFNVEGLVAVVTGMCFRIQLISGGGTGIGLSIIPPLRELANMIS